MDTPGRGFRRNRYDYLSETLLLTKVIIMYLLCKYITVHWILSWTVSSNIAVRRSYGMNRRLRDASRNEEPRDAAIGFSSAGRLLTVVHV